MLGDEYKNGLHEYNTPPELDVGYMNKLAPVGGLWVVGGRGKTRVG